jgi:hypothetical protein
MYATNRTVATAPKSRDTRKINRDAGATNVAYKENQFNPAAGNYFI